MNSLPYIIEILEQSVSKHGEKPMTNQWLLNILKMADRKMEEDENSPYHYDPDWD